MKKIVSKLKDSNLQQIQPKRQKLLPKNLTHNLYKLIQLPPIQGVALLNQNLKNILSQIKQHKMLDFLFLKRRTSAFVKWGENNNLNYSCQDISSCLQFAQIDSNIVIYYYTPMLTKRLIQLSKLFSTQRLDAPKKYSEIINRSRNIMNLYDLDVKYEGYVFVAPNATIVGDVWMGSDIAIWHGTVIRGDMNNITLGENISIGNNCVLHTSASSPTGLSARLIMRGDSVVQNNCTLYSCLVERGVYIGHNSVIMEGAILKKGCIIAPNSVVPPGRVVKERQVWGGNPIKYIRKALEQQVFVTKDYARYVHLASESYTSAFLPYNNAYLYRHGSVEPVEKNITVDHYQRDRHYNPYEATNNRY